MNMGSMKSTFIVPFFRLVAASLLFFILPVSSVSAQGLFSWQSFSAGVKAGVCLGDYKLTAPEYSIYKHSMSANAVAGAWLQYRSPFGLSIRPEVAYAGRGVNLEWEDVTYKLRANCLDVRMAVLFNLTLGKTAVAPYVVVAPAWCMAMYGRIDYSDYYTGDIVMPLSLSSMKRHDFGVFCGLGLEYPLHGDGWAIYLSAEAGYNWGLTNSFSHKEQGTSVSVLNPSLDQRPAMGDRFARGIEITVRIGVPFGKEIER